MPGLDIASIIGTSGAQPSSGVIPGAGPNISTHFGLPLSPTGIPGLGGGGLSTSSSATSGTGDFQGAPVMVGSTGGGVTFGNRSGGPSMMTMALIVGAGLGLLLLFKRK